MNEWRNNRIRHVESDNYIFGERKPYLDCSTTIWKRKNLQKMLHAINLQNVKGNYLTLTMSHFTYQCKVICKLCNYCTWDQDLNYAGAQLKLISLLPSIPSIISEERHRNTDQFWKYILCKKFYMLNIYNYISVYLCMEISFLLDQNSSSVSISRGIYKDL